MAYEQRGERDFGGRGGGQAGGDRDGGYEGVFIRGRGRRPITDYGSTVVHWMRKRQPRYKGSYQGEVERPSASYIIDMLPPLARLDKPAESVPARHLHTSLNKVKHPVNCVRWTPEGRRLLTGSSSGEFTLWNGTGFNFETIMQAHDVAIRALSYSHSDDWLLSADHDGLIKYWQPNFNNVKVIQGHGDAIRDLAFSPNDSKFVTASDDSTLKIFDFAGGMEESTLTGHGWDAKTVDWHPTKGLLVSGSKDHLVKLWDPRTGRCLTTLHGHKNTITRTVFEKVKGLCLASAARDQTARIFDLRMMRDICLLKGHEKDISTLTFHPLHPSLLSTGGSDGTIFHYLLDEPNTPAGTLPTLAPYDSPDPSIAPAQTIYPAHRINHAHEFPIWSLDWHPMGHILASGSNDRTAKFWTRARPGESDILLDRHHIGEAAAEAQGTWDRRGGRRQRQEEEEQEMEDEMEGLVDQKLAPKHATQAGFPNIPGIIPGMSIPGTGTNGNGNGMPAPPPLQMLQMFGAPPLLPGMDPSNPPDFAKLAEMMQKAGLPPPPLPPHLGGQGIGKGVGQFPPPPIPGSFMPPGFGAGGFGGNGSGSGDKVVPPPPVPQFGGGIPGMGTSFSGAGGVGSVGDDGGDGAGGSVRRRGPLPSQEESLQMEQRRGKYVRPR